MKYLTLLFLFLTSTAFSAEVKPIWYHLNFDQKLEVFRVYKKILGKADIDKVSILQDYSMISSAHAAELNCIYAGWPSSLVGGFCSHPKNMNQTYQANECTGSQLHCQPLLFGPGLCVPGDTRSQRNSSFKNCRRSFVRGGRSHETMLRELIENGKEAELLELFQFAEEICSNGRQKSTGMCRTLEDLVARLETKIESIDVIEQLENTTRVVAQLGLITSQRCVGTPQAASEIMTTDETPEELSLVSDPIEPEIIEQASAPIVSNSVASPSPAPAPAPVVTSRTSASSASENNSIPALTDPLAAIQSGNLRYLGRGMMNNGDGPVVRGGPGIRTCVYENDRVYLLYRGCMGNKSEAPNLEFTVIEKTSGAITQYYMETPNEFSGSLSQSGTDVYNSFRITRVEGTPVSSDMTMEQLRDHKNSQMHYNSNRPRCTFTDSVVSNYRGCQGNPSGGEQWLSAASTFRANPPRLWSQTLQSMRQLIVDTTY